MVQLDPGSKERNAPTKAAMANAKIKEMPLELLSMLSQIELISYTFYRGDVVFTDFLAHFSDVYVHRSG